MERDYRGSIIIPVVLCITFLLLSITIPFPVHAFEPDLEKDLQQSLIQSRAIVLQAEQKLLNASFIDEEITKIKEVSESIRINHALLQERFRLRQQAVNSLGVKAQDRHRVMEEGYLKALADYLNLVESLQQSSTPPLTSPLGKEGQREVINSIKLLLEQILPKKKQPIFGSLPYRNLNYPGREPDASPAIIPAYIGGNKTVSPDDTKDTPEAPLSLEIANLAQSLNWNPVSIYEYVKNNIETEWYWGCMKGAEETLRQKSGNECDQATLLDKSFWGRWINIFGDVANIVNICQDKPMPRQARLDAPGVLHHVMARGIEQRKIFRDDRDRQDFVTRLAGLVVSCSSQNCYTKSGLN